MDRRKGKGAATTAWLALFAVSRLGCDASVQTTPNCTALTACCATLGGADGQSCTASTSSSAITDEECLELLDTWQGQGACVQTAPTTSLSDGGVDATLDECGALGDCCARIADAGLDACASVLSNPSATETQCAAELAVLQGKALCGASAEVSGDDAGGGGVVGLADASDGGGGATDGGADACDDPECVDDCDGDPDCITSCGC